MNRKLIVLVIFTLLTSNIVNAGWFLTKKDVEKLKKRELLVITEPSEKFQKKYNKKPEKFEEAKKQIDIEANYMKDALAKYWRLNKEIKYVTIEEAKKLMKENKDKYAVMYKLRVEQEQRAGFGSFNLIGLNNWYDMVQITISFTPKFDKLSSMYVTLPDGKINDASYLASIRYLNNYLEETLNGTVWDIAKKEENYTKVQTSTLYLDKMFKDPKLADEDIPKYYSYPVKFVSKEEIDNAIRNEEDYIYIMKTSVVGMKETMKVHYFMNAKTGMYLRYANANEGSKINKKVLEVYNTAITQKKK